MKDSATARGLIGLRLACGIEVEHSGTGWEPILVVPNQKSKGHGGIVKQRQWLYRPKILGDPIEFSPVPKAAKEGKNSLPGIRLKAHEAIMQLAAKGRAGDKEAVELLVNTISGAIQELSLLATAQPENVRALAERIPYWPLRMSLNPQDINHAKRYMKELGVGAKAPTPTRPGQRIDRSQIWSSLAQQARIVCLLNIYLVPKLMLVSQSAKRTSRTKKLWRTLVKTMVYTLPNGDFIVMADWQEQCGQLREPTTRDNFEDWWRVMKVCVLEHWHQNKSAYQAAQKMIDPGSEMEEYVRRNKAMTSVRQAFKSLLELP